MWHSGRGLWTLVCLWELTDTGVPVCSAGAVLTLSWALRTAVLSASCRRPACSAPSLPVSSGAGWPGPLNLVAPQVHSLKGKVGKVVSG